MHKQGPAGLAIGEKRVVKQFCRDILAVYLENYPSARASSFVYLSFDSIIRHLGRVCKPTSID